jgi:hypothetical protein
MEKIKWANIEFLSLCPRGKNGLKVIYKADGKFELPVQIKKGEEFEQRGEIIAAIYVPNLPDYDDQFASDELAIKSMAYSHARNGSKLDLQHDGKQLTTDQAYMAESFIIQKDDPRFADLKDDAGHAIDPTGGWGAVIKLEDPILKSKYEQDGWVGVSLFGDALVQQVKSDEEKVLDRLKSNNKEKIRMDEKKIQELISKALEPITSVLEQLKTQKQEESQKKQEAPVFQGDPTNKEAVLAFQKELKKYELMKSVKWNDPKAVDTLIKQLEEQEKAVKKEEPKIELSKEVEAEIGRLKDQIAKLEKGSKQPVGDGKDMESEDERLYKLGKAAGAHINGQRMKETSKS